MHPAQLTPRARVLPDRRAAVAADRPARVVGTGPTQMFLDRLGFSGNASQAIFVEIASDLAPNEPPLIGG